MRLSFCPTRQNPFHAAQRSPRPAETTCGSSRCREECTCACSWCEGDSVGASGDRCSASVYGFDQADCAASSAKTGKRGSSSRTSRASCSSREKHFASCPWTAEVAVDPGSGSCCGSCSACANSCRSIDSAACECRDKRDAERSAESAFDSCASADHRRRRKVDGSRLGNDGPW
jgi:hypothetical protein